MELYQKIEGVLSKIISDKKSLEEATTNIYLTAMGVRPATMPFREIRFKIKGALVPSAYYMKTTKEGKETVKKINSLIPERGAKRVAAQVVNKISSLKVVIGEYHEGRDVVLVMNRKMYPKYKPLLQKMLDPSDKNHHIYVGTILGYTCPSNDFYKWEKQYEMGFVINGIRYMGVTCSMEKKYILKAVKKLVEIKKCIRKLKRDVEVELQIGVLL